MTPEKPVVAGDSVPPRLFEMLARTVRDYAIFLMDPAGKVATWNTGARLIKQYEEEEIIGKHFSLFYTPADIARNWPAHELHLAGKTGQFEDEGWRVRKDGTRFWANVIITALRDEQGTLLAYSKITRDLTGRKRDEETLRESEERFRLLVEGVQDYAIYLLDTAGTVTSWNTGANRIKGYEAHEIVGRNFSTFYSAEDRKKGKPAAELAMAREHGRAEDEGWRIRKNGSRFWARVVVTALHDANGNLRGYAKVTQDLTQHKHTEALADATQNINEFIAILAHELRNPLAPIRSAVHLMQSHNLGDAEKNHVVQIIDRQSSQLLRLVDDILDISRITRGTLAIVKSPILVSQLIARSVEAALPEINAKGHKLSVDLAEAPATFTGDEVRLAQALTNILNNAARYTEPGGRISVVASAGDGAYPELMIAVSDTGRGIDPAFLGAIFGMFVQGQNKPHTTATGLGVGLALAKSIVELHQGTLSAESAGPGTGSKFTIRMPLAQPLVRQPATAVETAAADPIRVLVVDDNSDAAFMLATWLRAQKHQVWIADNGNHALEIFDTQDPRLILLDIGMPEMNGLELARRIRGMSLRRQPYIVAVTGWGKPDDEVRSRNAGIDLHLVKPVEPEQLLAVLNSLGAEAQR